MSSAPFEINDDNEILKRMEFQKASEAEVAGFVPQALLRFVPPQVYSPRGGSPGGARGVGMGEIGGYNDQYDHQPPLPPPHPQHGMTMTSSGEVNVAMS